MRTTRRVVGWLGLAIGVHLALSAGFWFGVARHHKAIRNDQLVARAPRHVPVWITGDSHPRTAIDPRGLAPGAINAAFGSQSMVKSYYRTRSLVERHDKRVDVLIVPLDPVSLSGWNAGRYTPEVVWGRYVDFLEMGRVRGQPWSYVGRWLEAHVVPYAGELRTLNQLRNRRIGFGVGVPTGGDYGTLPLAFRQRQASREVAAHLRGGAVETGHRWALDQLITWAERRGTTVVLVRFPVTRLYADGMDDARRAVQDAVMGSIVNPERHVVLDHERLFARQPDLFFDPHHLNARGRARYTRVLRRELVSRGLLTDDASGGTPGAH